MIVTDAALLEQALTGAEDAFTALYRRRQGSVYRFALQMTGSTAIAEDVTQEAFLALLLHGTRYDEARGTVASFLYGIARNLVMRRLDRRPDAELEYVDEIAGPEDDGITGRLESNAASIVPFVDFLMPCCSRQLDAQWMQRLLNTSSYGFERKCESRIQKRRWSRLIKQCPGKLNTALVLGFDNSHVLREVENRRASQMW